MKIDITKILEISARIAVALFICSAILLFFPAKFLPSEVVELRSQHGGWLFVVFAFSIAILLSYLISHSISAFARIIKEKTEARRLWKSYKYRLQNLSEKEKLFLKKHYDKKETAIYFDPTDPIAKKLETFGFISMSSGINFGHPRAMPGFIQPWVFELIDKNPKYLDLSEDNSR